MDADLREVKTDIKNLYILVKRQDEDTRNLTKIATSVEVFAKEMEYMRNDIKDIKDENSEIRTQLNNHEKKGLDTKLSNYEYYKKEIVKWFILLVLGASIGVLINGGV